jgi:riboflavin synthase
MFSGIVECVGVVRGVEDRATTRRFRVEVPEFASELAPGDSVAVDGACLTVTVVDATSFAVDVIGTSLERTIAASYRDGTRVNLERALRAGGRLDGHIVQGHVDAVGHLKQSVKDGEFWLMDFVIPPGVHAQTIEHGSITLNGVSLTVSELLASDGVRIGVIPFTHEHTNLGTLRPGAPVNVEGDLIGKYVARLLAQRGQS